MTDFSTNHAYECHSLFRLSSVWIEAPSSWVFSFLLKGNNRPERLPWGISAGGIHKQQTNFFIFLSQENSLAWDRENSSNTWNFWATGNSPPSTGTFQAGSSTPTALPLAQRLSLAPRCVPPHSVLCLYASLSCAAGARRPVTVSHQPSADIVSSLCFVPAANNQLFPPKATTLPKERWSVLLDQALLTFEDC